MRVLVISDVHGRKDWKRIVDSVEWDVVVFLGDYFDSFDVSGVDQLDNFRDIVNFKVEYGDKVVLLCGNHDLHYLVDYQEYTGYQNVFAYRIKELLRPLQLSGDLIACKIIDGYLYSHAGVTLTWCHEWEVDHHNLEYDINNLFRYRPISFCFQSGYDSSGDNVFQSPLWVRPRSLKKDMINGYVHVVGHTIMNELHESEGVWFVDVMGTSGQFILIENGDVKIYKKS